MYKDKLLDTVTITRKDFINVCSRAVVKVAEENKEPSLIVMGSDIIHQIMNELFDDKSKEEKYVWQTMK